jgi:import inner membrane translocase subunit TIM16
MFDFSLCQCLLVLIDAAKNGGHHAKSSSGGSKAAAADAATRKTGMSVDEAMNILNITKEADLAKIVKV